MTWQDVSRAALRRVLPAAALAIGAALVDVGLLDAALYHAVAAVLAPFELK